MDHARDIDPAAAHTIIDQIRSRRECAHFGTDLFTGTPGFRILREHRKLASDHFHVLRCGVDAALLGDEIPNQVKVGLCELRNLENGGSSRLAFWREPLHTPRFHLCRKLMDGVLVVFVVFSALDLGETCANFIPFAKKPQPLAYHLARALVHPTLHLLLNQTVKFPRQGYVHAVMITKNGQVCYNPAPTYNWNGPQ
jgi:hypothetical protein